MRGPDEMNTNYFIDETGKDMAYVPFEGGDCPKNF